MNVIQRIGSLIKSQLPMLQSAMLFAQKKTYEDMMRRRERSRSSSR